MTVKQFDLLSYPLTGSSLIEASAGTGKTYTIALLYVRYILAQVEQASFTTNITPADILVVTFTDAAAKQLRDRIRTRLSQAVVCFSNPDKVDYDAELIELRNYYKHNLNQCISLMRGAEQLMDEAAISTIHSWCLRMLKEQVLHLATDFAPQMLTDPQQLYQQASLDYWRKFVTGLTLEQFSYFSSLYAKPNALLQDYYKYLATADYQPLVNLNDDLNSILQQGLQQSQVLKYPWLELAPQLMTLLDSDKQQGLLSLNKKLAKNYQRWLEQILAWAKNATSIAPALDKDFFISFAKENLAAGYKKSALNPNLVNHQAIAEIEQLQPKLQHVTQQLKTSINKHIVSWISNAVEQQKQQLNQFTFDDVIKRLAFVLNTESGAKLAQQIKQQFPVALIDEFQDTDQWQYQIFDAIYQVADNKQDSALVLIGDPKQSIYAFRNADINTYLRAKQSTSGRHFNLTTNYRSNPNMVQAVNALFNLGNNNVRGSFYFKTDSGQDLIPFIKVNSKDSNTKLIYQGQPITSALAWNLVDAQTSKDKAVQNIAESCAQQISYWLQQANDGLAGFKQENQTALMTVQPRDIAVLVNDKIEAKLVRDALRKANINSVYLSDKDSVFESDSAKQLFIWLKACLEPYNDTLVRSALATPYISFPWSKLDRFSHNEIEWEQQLISFQQLRECWQKYGVLAMLQLLMQRYGVIDFLVQQQNQRAITDLLHLAEILQQQSTKLDGASALVQYLQQQLNDGQNNSDISKRRLESDADLVQVVTVFKSKGLEYPLVFYPFATSSRKPKEELKQQIDQPIAGLAINSQADVLCAESIRKLYVALTRARYYTWIGITQLDNLTGSAIGYLLNNDFTTIELSQLEKLIGGNSSNMSLLQLPANPQFNPIAYVANDSVNYCEAKQLPEDFRYHHWAIASYSTMRFKHAAVSNLKEQNSLPQLASTDKLQLQSFPYGAKYGSFLHTLLEKLASLGFSQNKEQLVPEYQYYLANLCQQHKLTQWQELLQQATKQWLTSKFVLYQQQEASLADLSNYVMEMEFIFAIKESNIEKLDKLIRQYCHLEQAQQLGAPRGELVYQQLNGMLKGFIDLVFEHNGRYYVLDYKSNHLVDYQLVNLEVEICKHRYDVQFSLYLFALHLLLKARLGDSYDYEQHVGGVAYMFLRGIEQPNKGVFYFRPPLEFMQQLEQILQGKQ